MSRRNSVTLIVLAVIAVVVTGCSGVVGTPGPVTVTSTVNPGTPAEPGTGAESGSESSRAPDARQPDRDEGHRPGEGDDVAPPPPAAVDPDGATDQGADASQDTGAAGSTSTPDSPGSTDSDDESTRSADSDGSGTAGTQSGSSGDPASPPESLSRSNDLFAAAAKAATRAGVPPADPDTPGPDSGPECPGYPKYVDEAPTGLRSDVTEGWTAASKKAAAAGVPLCLNDGKRSRAQQQHQFDHYVEAYGQKVAETLALPPDESEHVVGLAVDVQPASGYQWLQSTDGGLGFCRTYDNEPWHFEFNPAYRTTGCPARMASPLDD